MVLNGGLFVSYMVQNMVRLELFMTDIVILVSIAKCSGVGIH